MFPDPPDPQPSPSKTPNSGPVPAAGLPSPAGWSLAGGWIDLSPTVTPTLGVWPGDTPVSREVLADMNAGDSLTLSTLRATVHLGSHADAPSHYGRTARSIEAQPIEPYLGAARHVEVAVKRGERVTIEAVEEGLRQQGADRSAHPEPRLLLRTGTFPDPTAWNEDFAGLEPALVDWAADRGILLIGVDTPSVDLFAAKTLVAHHRFLARDVAILEGLLLARLPVGPCELIALPLPLAGFDASPVRALARPIERTTRRD